MAQDLTVEADSGGHTDNRPLVAMFPAMLALRDRLQAEHRFASAPRVGAAGGIATPEGAAAAYMMGAAYVMTGSINQACVESGTCDKVREMLAQAGQADVVMAPAADMFEMGVKVQVLKRGTMFAQRGAKLYEAWRAYDSIEAVPSAARAAIERDMLKTTLEAAWESTKAYFLQRDPSQVERAEEGAQTQARPRVPLLPGPGLALGQRRRSRPRARLPGLVRPGDGRVQRMGQGLLPREAGRAPRRAGGPQHPLRRGRAHPRAFPPRPGRRLDP